MNLELTNEDKKRLSNQRQNAVRNAWKEERSRVSEGIGTRKWTVDEQKELLDKGRVSGYEGHHMKSVSLYPEYAGNTKNIQFLTEYEHLYGAHGGDYHNLTNGYYDPETEIMNEFGDELGDIPEYELNMNNLENDLMDNLRKDYKIDSERFGGKHVEMNIKEDHFNRNSEKSSTSYRKDLNNDNATYRIGRR